LCEKNIINLAHCCKTFETNLGLLWMLVVHSDFSKYFMVSSNLFESTVLYKSSGIKKSLEAILLPSPTLPSESEYYECGRVSFLFASLVYPPMCHVMRTGVRVSHVCIVTCMRVLYRSRAKAPDSG
jgi:hypothetical protein